MKSALLLALLLAIAAAAKPEWDNDWKAYKTKHGKNYKTTAEETTRRQNWENTRTAILKHNQEAATGKQTYTRDLNEFSDWSASELGQLTRAKAGKYARNIIHDALESELLTRQTPPASVDLRNVTCMPPVKNQGSCGSCWSFAANTPAEYSLCKKTGKLTLLSEQQLVDCSRAYGNNGCNGGWYVSAWQYVKAAPGEASSAAYPYTALNRTCRYTSSMSAGTVATYAYVARNVTTIQQAVITRGPLAAALQVINSFYSYSSGVYSDATCPTDINTVNHAVVIVGYGTLNSTNYWIVRNSWGSTWGQKGYFLIKRGVNLCNIESWTAYVTV